MAYVAGRLLPAANNMVIGYLFVSDTLMTINILTANYLLPIRFYHQTKKAAISEILV
tara:strand:+ start:295 stop:465 length:171 start_codon:yes stop_codon:yes gene_type:complete